MSGPLGFGLAGNDPNHLAKAPDSLVRAYFRCFSTFGPAIDGNVAVGDHVLALPAAVGNTTEFEQIAQCDVLVTQFEFQDIHAYAPRRRHK